MVKNTGNGSSGCLVSMLSLSFFAGNVFLFSGSLENDLSGNSFAIIMVLVAVIADIAFAYWIIESIVKHIEKARQQKLQAKSDAIKVEINKIMTWYRFPDIVIIGPPSQKDDIRVQQYDKEIIQRVNKYREETKNFRNELAELCRQNDAILACPDRYSDEQRLLFLQKETTRLEELKEKITDLVAECEEYRIVLPDADETALITLENALKEMQNSNKIKEDRAISLMEFLDCSNLPTELTCFKYNSSYISLTFKPFMFCLFPKVILVFKEDVFLSAIHPSELKIAITPVEASVVFSNNKYSSDIVDMDSKCVQVGFPSKTWMYVCKDGTPDLRYSYNPSTEYQVNRMMYGKAEFEIADFSTTFSFSSYNALETLEKAVQLYCGLDENALRDQQLVPLEQVDSHEYEVIGPVGNPQNLIIQGKKYSSSEYIKKTVAEFDALFSKCLTLQDIIEEYVASVDPQELMESTKIEILRFYLQHYSRFKSTNWTKKHLQALLSEQIKMSSNKFQVNTDKLCDEKQCTSQISVLISVLAAVLSSKKRE